MFKKLKEIRHKNKYTTHDISNKLGISKAFYCQIENRKRRLSYDLAVRIASIFNVKPDYLFYDDTLKSIENDEKEN